MDKDTFDFKFGQELVYTTPLSDGRLVELIPGGSGVVVRYEDRMEFIRLVQKSRLEESREQVKKKKTIIFGINRKNNILFEDVLSMYFLISPYNPVLNPSRVPALQIAAMQAGLVKVVPQAVLDLLTWQEVDKKVCGDPEITVEALKHLSESYSS